MALETDENNTSDGKAKPRVVVTRHLPDPVEARMAELFDAHFNSSDEPFDRNQLADAMQDCDVLVPTVTDVIDADLIAGAGEKLKLIAHYGTGVENIDVEAASAKGITVTNTPNVLNDDTAEMTMALLLSLPRRLVEGADILRREADAAWTGWAPTWMLGQRVAGKRIGIIGMGRIGLAVAQRAKAFGMDIHYHNRRRIAEREELALGATFHEDLDRMVSRVDFITIHAPSTIETHHLMNNRRLGLMKPTAYLINAARGAIIDEKALIKALRDDRFAGAALDVFEREPEIDGDLVALAREHKLVLLPHMSSATTEGREEMGERVVINIRTHADGHTPPDRVLPRRR
ncbi:MAG: D-glycerate dehydrogenase [Pseudomonadota bacterium]